MDCIQIIGELEALGVNLSLAIDYEFSGDLTPEIQSLLQKLSEDKEAAIDSFLCKRIVPLPENTPLPPQFRSKRMRQVQNIFRVCFDMLAKHEDVKTEARWREVYAYHEGKLDGNDPLAVAMHTAAISELRRQSKLPQ